MSPFLGSVFWLLVTLGVLVTLHEFGHFWVARRCGVRVLRFSIGMGPPLWKWTGKDGTEYWIAMLPIGGYVAMLNSNDGEVDPAYAGQEFNAQSVAKRSAIAAAGPAINLLFTILAFWVMYMVGRPDTAPIISATPASPAAVAGIQPGDRLLAVDGQPVSTMSDAMNIVADSLLGHDPLPVHVKGRDGTERNVVLPVQNLRSGDDIGKRFDELGLAPASPPPVIHEVVAGDPAALAGVRTGDRITSVNGKPVDTFGSFSKLVVQEAAVSPVLKVNLLRDGKPLTFDIKARQLSEGGNPPRWIVGVAAAPIEVATRRFGPLAAMGESLRATWSGAASTYNLIGKMITGEASSKNLSSVIGIAQAANQQASQGFAWFLGFLAMVSLSLAILNLLPIPILDGGQLVYYLIELIKGSPVSERTVRAFTLVGMVMVFAMMGLAFFNDIQRILVS
ncbi:RIP metalloprotease RseP [Bacillus sp. NP157]|nr:RIP metalloprotease RseP [Bacillus sp. NP157]